MPDGWDDVSYLQHDGEAWVYNEKCGSAKIVGAIQNYSELLRKDTTNDGVKETHWGMKQKSKTLPSADNDFGSSEVSFAWYNDYTWQEHDWSGSDLSNVVNIDYSPSSEQTSSFSSSVGVSFPSSVGFSVSADHGKVERFVNYDKNESIELEYDYTTSWGKDLATSWKDCQYALASGWISDRPSTDDKIAKSRFKAKFENDSGHCYNPVTYETSTGNAVYWYNHDINDS